MKLNTISNILLLAAHSVYSQRVTLGIDTDQLTKGVDWRAEISSGVQFAYIKSSDGPTPDPSFNGYWSQATNAGIVRGAYHKAVFRGPHPVEQSNFFTQRVGRWVPDGRTLPGALELSIDCTGIAPELIISWINAFSNGYKAANGRFPVIFTTTTWWTTCTRNSPAFAGTNRLWISNKGNTVGALPAGWRQATFWQNSDNHDLFDGDLNMLRAFANTPI